MENRDASSFIYSLSSFNYYKPPFTDYHSNPSAANNIKSLERPLQRSDQTSNFSLAAYRADFLLPPTVPTPSKWIIKSLVKNSDGHVCLTCPCMYSEAIWTCSALIPGREATFLPSSSNIGARYDGSIDLFESLMFSSCTSCVERDGETYSGLLGVLDPLP